MITNFGVLPTKNWHVTLLLAKTTSKKNIFGVFHVFANDEVLIFSRQGLRILVALKFVISDPKNQCEPNMDIYSVIIAKILLTF